MEYAIETQVIDAAQREVRRQDACVPVEPKVFDLLLYLVENRARVVAKDELVERIWNGRAISDAALSSCVKAARRTLGDDGQQQRFIRTINRCGFRFVGPVETHDQTMPAADVQARSPKFGAAEAGVDTSPADAAAYDIDMTLPARP
jgi:DNA-binding winged helix-turn-helix (wHTH) protein